MNNIPDYTNTYFPPPPGAARAIPTTATTYYPPPPDRSSLPTTSHQTYTPQARPAHTSASSLTHTSNLRVSQEHAQRHHVRPFAPSSLYQPHAAAYQTSPLPSPSLHLPGHSTRPASPSFHTPFASLSLHFTDRLRFVRFPSTLYPLLRSTIESHWPRGIISIHGFNTSIIEFRLKGHPWSSKSTEIDIVRTVLTRPAPESQAMAVHRLFCALLNTLFDRGWLLRQRTAGSRGAWNADAFIFRHQAPLLAPQEWFSLSFCAQNKLRCVDAPRALCLRFIEFFSIRGMEVSVKEDGKLGACCDIKLGGDGVLQEEGNEAVLLESLQCLEESGWTVYASLGLHMSGGDGGWADTWFCCRPVEWVEGGPVYPG